MDAAPRQRQLPEYSYYMSMPPFWAITNEVSITTLVMMLLWHGIQGPTLEHDCLDCRMSVRSRMDQLTMFDCMIIAQFDFTQFCVLGFSSSCCCTVNDFGCNKYCVQ